MKIYLPYSVTNRLALEITARCKRGSTAERTRNGASTRSSGARGRRRCCGLNQELSMSIRDRSSQAVIGILAGWLCLASCHAPTPSPTAASPQSPTNGDPSPATGSTSAAGSGSAAGASSAGAPSRLVASPISPQCPSAEILTAPVAGTPCGPLGCRSFARAEDAVAYVVTETSPLILAVGEIHVQKDSALGASPTRRFASLLPMFCGTTRHIVIELWTGRNDCGDRRVEKVRKAQRPVTQAQASTNQNDFYELGNVAKANRIMPHALTPSCEDFQSIIQAQDQDIERMLELTASRTADTAEELLKNRPPTAKSPYVILYGGAMHNDLSPAEGRQGFSFGPRLANSTNHRISELDLVLREQVRDTESYRHMAWYPHFRAETLEKQYTLYQLGPRSFALIYPSQGPQP